VIQDARSPLAGLIADELRRYGANVVVVDQGQLAQEPVTISSERVSLRGDPLDCVAWLVDPSSTYSDSFRASDVAFVDSETLALWAAILHHPSVRSTYRAGIAGLIEGRAWPYWRRELTGRLTPLAPLHFGGRAGGPGNPMKIFWLPYSHAKTETVASAAVMNLLGAAAYCGAPPVETIYVAGQPLDSNCRAGAANTGKELLAAGLVMALGLADGGGRMIAVDPFPAPVDEGKCKEAARLLADFLVGGSRVASCFTDNPERAPP
jgi:hypothetical protein